MLKVIDLDHTSTPKDRDAYVFTLTVNGDKIGVTEDELAELIRGKAGGQKGAKKGRKAQGSADGEHEQNQPAEFDTPADKAGSWISKPQLDSDPSSLA